MKKSELRQLIKEEIKFFLTEDINKKAEKTIKNLKILLKKFKEGVRKEGHSV